MDMFVHFLCACFLDIGRCYLGNVCKTSASNLLTPVSCGCDGEAPLIIHLPPLHEDAGEMAERLSVAHREGRA